MSSAPAEHSPFAFAPRPGETEWWRGDPRKLPLIRSQDIYADIIARRQVLTSQQCRALINCFERNREACTIKDCAPYWAGRYIWQDRLPAAEGNALRIMQQVRFLAQLLLTRAIQPSRPIYSDTAQLVRWHAGIELTPHADNLEPDGRPNSTPHRCFSSLMYLNDDYDGGETYFPGYGVRLRPETGTLILFGAGPEFVHGVTQITRGLRYTYAGWFTFDSHMEDAKALKIF